MNKDADYSDHPLGKWTCTFCLSAVPPLQRLQLKHELAAGRRRRRAFVLQTGTPAGKEMSLCQQPEVSVETVGYSCFFICLFLLTYWSFALTMWWHSRCEARATWGTTWKGGGRRGWRGLKSQYQGTVCPSTTWVQSGEKKLQNKRQ